MFDYIGRNTVFFRGSFSNILRLQFFPTLSKNCTNGLKISSRFMHLFMLWDVLKIDGNISVLRSILVRLASFFSDIHQAVLAATDLRRFVQKYFQKNEIFIWFFWISVSDLYFYFCWGAAALQCSEYQSFSGVMKITQSF